METITILKSKKWLKSLIIDESVAKGYILKRITKKHKFHGRVAFLNQHETMITLREMYPEITASYKKISAFTTLIMVNAKKGFDLNKIFPH
jgi:hypothetical protein